MSESNAHNSEAKIEAASDLDITHGSEAIEPAFHEVSRRLSEARIARGLSQEQVAKKLYFNPSWIRYIDEGDFDKIGKPAFLKGYIRSYARELGLSGDDIVGLLDQSDDISEVGSRLHKIGEQPQISASATPQTTTAMYGLVGVVVVLVLIWWMSPEEMPDRFGSQDIPAVVDPAVVDPAEKVSDLSGDEEIFDDLSSADDQLVSSDPLDNMAVPDLGELNQEEPETDLVQQNLTNGSEGLAGNLDGTTDETSTVPDKSVKISHQQEGGRSVTEVIAGGDDNLNFTFTEDCWLEIVDAEGMPIYGDLNQDRDVLNVTGIAPFKLLIGRVSAVSLTFNGNIVDIEAHAFNDTASMIVE